MKRTLMAIIAVAILAGVTAHPSHALGKRERRILGYVAVGVVTYSLGYDRGYERAKERYRYDYRDRHHRYRRSPRYYGDDGYRYRSRRYYRYEERYEDVDCPRRDGRRDRYYR